MASVYHFFPGPVAVSIALSERYMGGFYEVLSKPVENRDSLSWQEIVGVLMDRGVAFYRAHPYAQTLVQGSDHSWHIRRSDLANNRAIAGSVVDLIGDKFPSVPPTALVEAVVVGISIGDAVLTLSIAEQGGITPAYGREAVVAICGYLTTKFGLVSQPAR
jgi:Tetracyclin repressor-like, C-terminal domain